MHVDALVERADGLRATGVDGQRHDLKIRTAKLRLQRIEHRHLVHAGRAPGRPQVQQHSAAPEVGQRDRVLLAADEVQLRKLARGLVQRHRRRTVRDICRRTVDEVARGERNKRNQSDECRHRVASSAMALLSALVLPPGSSLPEPTLYACEGERSRVVVDAQLRRRRPLVLDDVHMIYPRVREQTFDDASYASLA